MKYFSIKKTFFIAPSQKCNEEFKKIDKFMNLLENSGVGKIIENISSNKIVDFIKTIKDDSSKLNINSLKNFISINRDFTINDNPYKPSKGELAILSLQHDLLTKKDYDIFLIDEPEANLGSTYIND